MTTKFILHFTYMHKTFDVNGNRTKENYSPVTLISTLDSKIGFEPDKDKENLRKIFGFLNFPIIAELQEELKDCKIFPRMTPPEFCEYCLELDKSLLLKLIYALATGKILINPSKMSRTIDTKIKNNFLSNFYVVCLAKCMIEQVNTDAPGPLQMMVADMFYMVNAPKQMEEFMSNISLSDGQRMMDRMVLKRALIDKLLKFRMSPLDTWVLHLDNFVFKRRKGKFSQHTVIQIAKIKAETLCQLGFI